MIKPKTLNDYEKGFIECFIDTDGCIVFGNKKSQSYISIQLVFSNNSRNILDKIQEIFNSNKNYTVYKTSAGNNHYVLVYQANTCRWILPQLKLVIKEEKRKLALEILNVRKGINRNYKRINKKRFIKRLEDIKNSKMITKKKQIQIFIGNEILPEIPIKEEKLYSNISK